MRLTFRLLPAMLFLSICSYAQNGTGKIKGVVMDDSGDEALTGATLIIEELKIGETAGKDGDFSFSGLKASTYTVSVDYMGYVAQSKKVTVTACQTSHVNF